MRDEVHGQVPDDSSSPAGALPALRRRARRGAARGFRRASAARAGPAAHRGAHHLPVACRSHAADSRCTCAADGGTAAGHPVFLRCAHA